MNKYIDNTNKIIPLISTVILLSGIIKYYIYYNYFNININEYIDLSEFPLLFISDILLYVIIFIIYFSYLPIPYIKEYFMKKYGAHNFSFKYSKVVVPIVLISFILLFLNSIVTNSFSKIDVFAIQAELAFIFGTVLLFLKLKNVRTYTIIVCLFMMLTFPILNGISDIDLIKKGMSSYNISFSYNKDEFETNTNHLIFIGKTRNYVYLYDVKTKYTHIFNFANIENFKIIRTNL